MGKHYPMACDRVNEYLVMLSSMVSTTTLSVALSLSLYVSLGCSRKPLSGTVSGKVTCKNQPVTDGSITFRNEIKGLVASMKLGAAGEYELRFAGGKEIPLGDYVVTVSPPEPYVPSAADWGQPPPPQTRISHSANIPAKYHSPRTSGLTATVQEGPNRFDFDMYD